MNKYATVMLVLTSSIILLIGLSCAPVPPPDTDGGTTPDTNGTGNGSADDGGGGQDVPEISDLCPDDPDKTSPGICDCGVADTDTDGDGTPDCNDECPNDSLNDSDGDGVCGDVDNCPDDVNADQADSDGDSYGDVCDICPNDPLNDSDGDGVCGDVDNCPNDANADQIDSDGDGIGNICDSDTGGGGGLSCPPIEGPTYTLNVSGVAIELIRIPAGTFDMGTDNTDYDHLQFSRPVHTVTIANPFYMGKYEITQEQWQAVMGTTPWSGQPWVLEQGDCAATFVSWNDCQAFCQKIQTDTACSARLPSEAEWEYACRAGSTTEYYFGDVALPDLDSYAWYDNNAFNVPGQGYAHPVGQMLPNDFGLYDMHGNVNEWCKDEWHTSYTGAPSDGSAWVDGSYTTRIIRGGSWVDIADDCRSAIRYGSAPGTGSDAKGFRIVLDAN